MTDPFSKETTMLSAATYSPQDVRKDLAPITSLEPFDPFGCIELSAWEQPLPPIDWICEGLRIAKGTLVLLSGDSFSGKSLLAHDLALSVAGHGDAIATPKVLNAYSTNHWGKRVFYVDFEQGKRQTIERFQRLARAKDLDLVDLIRNRQLNVASHSDVHLQRNGVFDSLRRLADSGTGLIVFDTLRAALPEADENSSDIRRHLDPLSKIAHDTHMTIVLIHHANKSEDRGSKIRGSSAIRDVADTVWTATSGRDSENDTPKPTQLHHDKCRPHGELQPDVFFEISSKFKDGNSRWGLELCKTETQQKISVNATKHSGTTSANSLSKSLVNKILNG